MYIYSYLFVFQTLNIKINFLNLKLIMGASQFKCQPPKINQFQLLNYGYCTVWKRKSDQLQLMEQYDVQIDTLEKLHLYKSLWTIRTKNPYLVNVCYFTHQTSKNFCGSMESGSIFTQRIYYRLSQFSNINYETGMSILQTCFYGYKILYQTSGLFLVRSTMIGFNQQMKIKVWLHTDYSQAEPQNPNCNSLIQMIKSIIECVQRNLSFPYNYPKFSQFLSDKLFYLTNFSQIQIALDQYSKNYGLQMKSSNSSIKSFLRKAQGWEVFAIKSQYQKFQQYQHSKLKQSQFSKTVNAYNNQKPIKNFRQSINHYTQDSYFQDPLSKTVKKQYFSSPYFDSIDRSNISSVHINNFQFAKQQKTPKTRINKPEMYLNMKMNGQKQQIKNQKNKNFNQRASKSQQHFHTTFIKPQIQQSSSLRPKFIRQPPKMRNQTKQIQNQYYNTYSFQNQKPFINKNNKKIDNNINSFIPQQNMNFNRNSNQNNQQIQSNSRNSRDYRMSIVDERDDKSKSKSLSSSISLIEDLQAKHRVEKILNRGRNFHKY